MERAQPTTTSETLVILQRDTNEFSFRDTEGNAVHPPNGYISKSTNGSKLAEELAQMYVAVGPGTHNSPYVAKAAGLENTLHASRAAMTLAKIMPESIITCGRPDGQPKEPIQITFGNFAVAVAVHPATADELAQRKARVQAHVEAIPAARVARQAAIENKARAKLEKIKARVEAEEPTKLHLTAYDHATFRIGRQYYFIDLNSPEALLAFRFLSSLNQVSRIFNASQQAYWL